VLPFENRFQCHNSSTTSTQSILLPVTMLLQKSLLVSFLAASASAWVAPSAFSNNFRTVAPRAPTALFAIDYNNPVVAEEFAKVQPMDLDTVEAELLETGIRAPATMNEMDIKLMLVELRLRNSGKLSDKPKEIPKTFSSKFEEAIYTKPAFAEYYNELKAAGDMNTMNVIGEYLNNPEEAKVRYGVSYKTALRKVDEALTAPPPVNSPTLTFSGFPSNMGEMGVKMTLEALGAVSEFECAESEDFPVLSGKITYEDIEDAKTAVEKYNGMDMGMGTTLEIVSV